MFRKPRDSGSSESGSRILGRPPSPPNTPARTPFTLAVPPTITQHRMTASIKASKPVPLPTIGRQGPSSNKKSSSSAKSKSGSRPNTSILSFFKKSDGDQELESGLFVQGRNVEVIPIVESEALDTAQDESEEASETRYNEIERSEKRRRLSQKEDDGPSTQVEALSSTNPLRGKSGPFLEDSDSEADYGSPSKPERRSPKSTLHPPETNSNKNEAPSEPFIQEFTTPPETQKDSTPIRPPLIKEETSYTPDLSEFRDFEDGDDFDEDLFEEGDEYLERRYMEEHQALIDHEEAESSHEGPVKVEEDFEDAENQQTIADCPICGISLIGIGAHDAGVHVNDCLDGNPSPLPERKKPVTSNPTIKAESVSSATQYRRADRAARPPQASPFMLGQSDPTNGSAFNKLMSGHAESAAWAEAAAAEHAARGKPFYQRTCPFYKILPGLFICVDAFRYGAVEGCAAYFLSHFHSDHYVGLTSHWNHGPIYCSKVTANLVRQQLRVDPQYVVPLDFEETVEVPGTRGVKVTMISANHCPGSSLYLFEKTVGRKQNREPRLQRILHCGDFRACRQHVEHPLLMPNVQDQVSGRLKDQRIDVCYLDTTYLNPKYAFPSQEAVITACADMCVCLSKDSADENDGWEQMKRQRAGEGMVKFVRRENSCNNTSEQPNPEDTDTLKIADNPHASQQILTSAKEQTTRGRLLVVVGTYSIGKERICLGIAQALDSKIYAPPSKQRIVAALQDPELDARMTSDPRAAQVHMTPLFEIRAETLDDYLKDFFPHFTRAVGFRPSGWNYRPPNSRFIDSPTVQTVLHSENWRSAYSMRELVPQRGSTSRASCFGVPYSEHSSFRELTMFCCALRIEKIIPTVNVGSAKSRERMKAWCERWAMERKKNGLYELPDDGSW